MKITYIIPTLNTGGAEKFVVDLINEAVKNKLCKISLIVLFSDKKESFLSKKISSNIDCHFMNYRITSKIAVLYKVNVLLNKINSDIIHTHLSALIYIIPYLFLKKVKCFHTIHNVANLEAPKLNKLINKACFHFLNVTPISISEAVKESIVKEYGVSSILICNGTKAIVQTNKIDRVREQINLYKFEMGNSKAKVLLSIARIDPQKNQELLIRAIPKDGRVLLLMLGADAYPDSEYSNSIKNLIMANRDCIKYLSIVDNVGDFIECCDAIVFSSLYEGLPISLIEAMSLGKPCISTPAGGIPDVIDNSCSYISTSFEFDAFQNAINDYLSDNTQSLIDKKVKLQQLFLNKYSIEDCFIKHLRVYLS